MNSFERTISGYLHQGLHAEDIEILQVNTGLLCNQSCSYCCLECGTDRTEVMSWPVMEQVINAAEYIQPRTVDIAGGAPELNPYIRELVAVLRENRFHVQLRTNLTAMTEPGTEDLPAFLRDHGVKLVASLSCFTEENVCEQRGERVYEKSIIALKRLADVGYKVNSQLQLNLVYNPGGTALPGKQSATQAAYRRELYSQHRISFSRLQSITNVPLGRYRTMLRREGRDVQYARLLEKAFNPRTLDLLMCRHQVSVSWDGTIYDCDINLALGMEVKNGPGSRLDDVDLDSLPGRRIITGDHCFGCTAGYGSFSSGLIGGSAS